MPIRRFAWFAVVGAAPAAWVAPAHAQTPSTYGGSYAVSGSLSFPSAPADRFEGTFTQTQQSPAIVAGALPGPSIAARAARFGASSSADHEISGRLVWTPTDVLARPKTFGDVESQFYVPTDGALTVSFKMEARSQDGTCTQEGSRTFALRALPPAALQNLYLEVAADGRYKMMLGMINYFLPLEAAQRCTFKVRTGTQDTVPITEAGVVIGPQQGLLTDDAIAGATAQPIAYGVHSYSGRWDFKKVEP